MNKYFDLPYPKPSVFENKYHDKSALIIGTGHSTKNLISFKNKLKNKFDVIIGLNFATNDFEEQLDFHIILEKNPVKSYKAMQKESYRKDLPRILNWKSINKFPKDINIVKATRCNFDGKPNIQKYKHNNQEGLLIGPLGNKKLSIGTVTLNAIHFAGILGCTKIYLMGADLIFRDKYDHYYPDSHYRQSTTKIANRSPIIDIMHKGNKYKTTILFKESAKYIDNVIENLCRPVGIEVYDFSDGLIQKATQLNIDDFMQR